MDKYNVQQKYDDLRPHITPNFTAESVSTLISDIKRILSRYEGCGIGRTSGSLVDAQNDCDDTLTIHNQNGLPYTKTHHVTSLVSAEAMVRLEAYIIAKLASEGYKLGNIAYDGRGNVAQDAVQHLYIATTNIKKS